MVQKQGYKIKATEHGVMPFVFFVLWGKKSPESKMSLFSDQVGGFKEAII